MCMDPHFYVKRQVAIIEVLDSFLEANEVQVETKGPSVSWRKCMGVKFCT